MLLTAQAARQPVLHTCRAGAPPECTACDRVSVPCIARCPAAPRRWRLRVIAQEALPLTLPDSPGDVDDGVDDGSLLVANTDQIERLLAHIHRRLPHSKPARALLRAPLPAHSEDPLHDATEPPHPPPRGPPRPRPHSHSEFRSADGQLQLQLDGSGIHLTLLDDPLAPATPRHYPDAAPTEDSRTHGPGLTHHALLSSVPGSRMAAPWPVPGGVPEAVGAPPPPPLVVSGGPLMEDTAARQRQWLQQLLDRPLATEPPRAPATAADPTAPAQRRAATTGARTKRCGCGAVLHNRVATCPDCGHQFYSAAAAKPRPPGAQPLRKRIPKPGKPVVAQPPPVVPPATVEPRDQPRQPLMAMHAASSCEPTHTPYPMPRPHPTSSLGAAAAGLSPSPAPAEHAASGPYGVPGSRVLAVAASDQPPATARGNSVEQVVAVLGVPAGAARRLMTANPNLGTLPPAKVAGRVQELAATLSVTRELALALVLRQPSLLSLTPGTLRQHFDGLCAHLHLPPRELRRVVAKCPDMLLMAPASVARKLQRIAAMLRVSPLQVLQLAMTAPKLVSLTVDNLREKLLFCRNTLGISQPTRLFKVLQAHPSLLTRSAAGMRARFSGTAALLGLSVEDARRAFQLMPALLYKHCDSVEAKVGQLAELLGVPKEQATRLAAQNLCLLGMDASGWGARIDALAAALGLRREVVVKMLARMPSLLGFKPAPLGERLRKMAARLRLPRERVRQMVEAQPSLLTMKYAVLARRWQALCALAAMEPSWRRQLLGYEVSSMAVLLSRSDDAFLRLQYLASSGAASSVALATAAQLRPPQFRARYPGFLPWVNEVVLRSSLQRGRRVGKGGVLRAMLKASAAGDLPPSPLSAAAQQ